MRQRGDQNKGEDHSASLNQKQRLLQNSSKNQSNIEYFKDQAKIINAEKDKVEEVIHQKQDRIYVAILEDKNVS